MMKDSGDQTRVNITLKQTIHKYYSAILSACPNKSLPAVDDLGKPPARIHQPATMTVPTAAALKMGVGFPLNNRPHDGNGGRVLSSQASRQDNLLLNNECGICHQGNDQHLLAKCDTCHLYYHLYCLNPPLTRLPKKSKLYGWQCSECDKTSDSEQEIIETKTPRRSRTRYSKDDSSANETFTPSIPEIIRKENFAPIVKIKPLEQQPYLLQSTSSYNVEISSKSSSKKRRRDKHRSRYSPDLMSSSREHKRKRKKKSLDIENPNIIHPRITIKVVFQSVYP